MGSGFKPRALLESLIVAPAYIVTGQLCFYLAINPGNVTAVWAPAGVALGALLLRGNRCWPGIWLGALIVNLLFYFNASTLSVSSVFTAAAIGLGSTLQALSAAYLLNRRMKGERFLNRPGDAFFFIAIAAACCCIASGIGVTSLCMAGYLPWQQFGYTWLTWWAGDTGGMLVYAPLILTWKTVPDYLRNSRRAAEFAAFLIALGVCCYVVFGQSHFGVHHDPLLFCVFPFLVWAAGRFGTSAVTLTVPLVELAAIAGLKHGFGPLIAATQNQSLLLLAMFMAVLVLIGLTFSSVINQWQSFKDRLENTALDLEEKVRERTIELEESNRKLVVARDEAVVASNVKSAFIANISHELRTPLSGILGMTELLLDSEEHQEKRRMLEIVYESGQSLLAVVNDILDLAKIEAGKLAIDCEPFNPALLAQDCTKLLSAQAAKKKLKLTVSLDSQLPSFVFGDAVRVRQALINLIGNAIKFTEAGSISVSVDLEDPCGRSNSVRFSVRDTGIGIPGDKQKILFTPFSQADTTITRKFGGAGLGLALSRRLVQLMGGEMGFESDVNAGSFFWFTIPCDARCPLTEESTTAGER